MGSKDKKEQILDAAIQVFYEKGFSSATTSEIAKRAGVAEGTIFRYFKTKKEILEKVMRKLIDFIGQELVTNRIGAIIDNNKDIDPRDVLKAIIKDRIQLLESNKEMIQIIITELQYHNDLRQAFIENVAVKAKSILEKFINQGMEKGIFKNMNSEIVVRSLAGIIAAYFFQKQVAPQMINIPDDEEIDTMIDLFLYGIYK